MSTTSIPQLGRFGNLNAAQQMAESEALTSSAADAPSSPLSAGWYRHGSPKA